MNFGDTVALLVNAEGYSMSDQDICLTRGLVGTVIEAMNSDVVIVEFAGIDGVAYAIGSIACGNLLPLHHAPSASD